MLSLRQLLPAENLRKSMCVWEAGEEEASLIGRGVDQNLNV